MTVGVRLAAARWFAVRGLWLALALLGCCALCPVSDAMRVQSFETPIGGQRVVILPDGSRVVLNTDSSVRMRVDGFVTRVEILWGEVFFRTKTSARRSLSVRAGGLDIGARGTGSGFNVRLNGSGDVRVTVAQGQVRISGKPVHTSGNPEAWLRENQEAMIESGTMSAVMNVTPEAIGRELSWVDGELVFEGARLSDVVQEINRYNLTRIEVADPSVGERRIGGSFSAVDPFAFVTSVVKVYPAVRWACERGEAGTLVLRLRLTKAHAESVGASPGCVSVTLSDVSSGAVQRD